MSSAFDPQSPNRNIFVEVTAESPILDHLQLKTLFFPLTTNTYRNSQMDSNTAPQQIEPVPHSIIADVNDAFWQVSWAPNAAGIITVGSCLFPKADLLARFPHVVGDWEERQRGGQEGLQRMQRNASALMRQINDYDPEAETEHVQQAEPGVACDQHLLPGMYKHWGELRRCEKHPPNQPGFNICKGCRVSHHAQDSQTFDRALLMARGARVPVCGKCATKVVRQYGGEYRGCDCDSHWTCFRCREAELGRLARARRHIHVEETCGQCGVGGVLVSHVDYCVYCRRARVYVASD